MRFSCVDMNICVTEFSTILIWFTNSKLFVIFAVGGASPYGHGHEQWGVELDPGDHQ